MLAAEWVSITIFFGVTIPKVRDSKPGGGKPEEEELGLLT
eukprot:CAMPEP_0185758492 /NCGR_PEP_ID=MMETSP1174-20130828/17163_1 /TAXON_ID=35687 /ORGANISM="Dictyocha speculum, Strain CCMP1381" /LENGTH=39 /DNA_ID= /DNA_START= /DNA_END= /DNA_ORIENTATION=